MSDCLHFPDTVEEFMEQYKMTDTKQVYSNGIEYVPMFRMKQWFEHENAQHYQEGTTSDTISRQAAIDIERNATVDTNPSHFEAHQKFTQFMDDAEISSFGRWQWSNGFNTALTAVEIDLEKLPSAQPEEAIPVSWIEARIERFKAEDNAFCGLTANIMLVMLNEWKWEQERETK